MSRRWRIAGLVAAGVVFVTTMIGEWSGSDLLASLPLVLQAVINAVAAFLAIWLIEGIFLVALSVLRGRFPGRP